jgi:hypothetical protein
MNEDRSRAKIGALWPPGALGRIHELSEGTIPACRGCVLLTSDLTGHASSTISQSMMRLYPGDCGGTS